jgi:hypothetical protein
MVLAVIHGSAARSPDTHGGDPHHCSVWVIRFMV